jgi:hypothetical protein
MLEMISLHIFDGGTNFCIPLWKAFIFCIILIENIFQVVLLCPSYNNAALAAWLRELPEHSMCVLWRIYLPLSVVPLITGGKAAEGGCRSTVLA